MLMCSVKTELTPLAIGGLFFFLINFVLAILQIQYVFQQNLAPDYLNVVQSIIEFICTIGTYTGLILCFKRWNNSVRISAPQKLTDDEENEKESCASSIRSYHSMVYAQQQQQLHYAVPQGAPPSQQVHMFRPWWFSWWCLLFSNLWRMRDVYVLVYYGIMYIVVKNWFLNLYSSAFATLTVPP